MPSEGRAYRVDDSFRRRVKRGLESKGASRADLARALKCSKGAITALLKPTAEGGVQQSPLVPAIHLFFDWSRPIEPEDEEEASEAIELFKKMDAVARARWLERGQAILEEAKRRK